MCISFNSKISMYVYWFQFEYFDVNVLVLNYLEAYQFRFKYSDVSLLVSIRIFRCKSIGFNSNISIKAYWFRFKYFAESPLVSIRIF